MATREEQIILDFEIDTKDSIKSIEDLTKANKALREERNKLNLQTEEGKKRAHEINTILDHNTKKIKDNSSALEKQRLNIGNYKSALDGVHPALGKVATGLDSGAEGFKKMTLQALRFIATPIGAVLAAIVAVFSLLKAALQQNDGLMDKFENVTNAVGVALEIVVSRVGKLGEALIKLASGNFTGAIDSAAEAFSGLGDEIANAVKQQQLFLDASRDLEDSERRLRIETERQGLQIAKLVKESKNRNLTLDQSAALLTEAADKEKNLQRTREDLATRALIITARQLRADKEFQQQSNENFDQYVERLLDSSKLGDDEKNKLVDAIVKVEQARNSSLVLQQKIENDLAAIQDKKAEAIRKANEELAKQSELERQQRIARLERDLKGNESTNPFATEIKLSKDLTKNLNEQLAERSKATEEYYKKKAQDAKKSAELEEQVERDKTQIIGNLLGSLTGLMKQDSEEQKIITSAQALINTYAAANAAFKSGSEINVLFGVLSAAAATAAGLANVARINGVQFAEGGWTGPGNKYDAVGIVHADEYVTPKRVKNSPEAQPHIMALERMRLRGYADGGLVTNSISQPINQQLELANIVKNMPAPVVGVKEVTKMQNRVRVKEQASKR